MENSNFKVYIGISIGLVVLLILIIIIPFSKKTDNNSSATINNFPSPTSININTIKNSSSQNIVPADSTGVAEEQLPQEIVNAASQKQDLRKILPISLTSFDISFNYSEDKFTVILKEPKDQSRNEFDQWRNNTYSKIEVNQFNFQ